MNEGRFEAPGDLENAKESVPPLGLSWLTCDGLYKKFMVGLCDRGEYPAIVVTPELESLILYC